MLHTAGPEFSLPAPVCKGNHTEVHALEKTGGGRIRKDPKLWEVVLPKYISRNGRKPEIGQLFVELRHGRRRALSVTLPSAGLTHRQHREGGGCAFGSRREPGLFCRPRSGHHGPFTKTRTQPSRGVDVSRSQFSVIEGDLMAPNRKSAGASWKLERSLTGCHTRRPGRSGGHSVWHSLRRRRMGRAARDVPGARLNAPAAVDWFWHWLDPVILDDPSSCRHARP